jgi:hypothetical protein
MSIKVLVQEGLPKRVCIVRNGMVITDNLAKFGDKFSSFPLYKDFVAFVEPLDVAGSSVIKHLENPKHDNLSADRLADAKKKAESTRDMKRLARIVRDAIKEQALPKPTSEMSIDELTEFFVDRNTTKPPGPGAEENPETYRYERGVPRMVREPSAKYATGRGVTGGAGGDRGSGGGGGGGGHGPKHGGGTGGAGKKARTRALQIVDFRNVLESADSNWDRRLLFTPKETGKAAITLYASGLDSPEEIPVVASESGTASSGRLLMDLTADKRVSVRVKLSERYLGPVQLEAASTESAAA